MDIPYTEKFEGCDISVFYDDNPESPDEWGDDAAFLVAFHRDFTVEHPGFETPDKYVAWIETHEIYSLYAYIHSGVVLSMDDGSYPFNDQWDACQVGYVVVTKDECDIPNPEEYAEGIVKSWNQYLSGSVFAFTVSDEEGEVVDSCFGFYGDDEYPLTEARESAKLFKSEI